MMCFVILEYFVLFVSPVTAVIAFAVLWSGNDCEKLKCFVVGVVSTVVFFCHWHPYDVELSRIVADVKGIGTLEKEKIPKKLQRASERLQEYRAENPDMETSSAPLSKLIEDTKRALEGDSTKSEALKEALQHMEYFHQYLPGYWDYRLAYRHLLAILDVIFAAGFLVLAVLILKDNT